MLASRFVLSLGLLVVNVAASRYKPPPPRQYPEPVETITRDVCIIGGGSSGTYAAIGLRDRGQSVAVVERTDYLGGHTHTYRDPATNLTSDTGVLIFHNNDFVRGYFGRFDVPLVTIDTAAPSPVSREYVDFRTGAVVEDFVATDPREGLKRYAEQLARYPYLDESYDLPDPVPEDLLLPFQQFVTKYELDDAVFLLWTYNQGIGDMLNRLTLYVAKYFGIEVVDNVVNGFLSTARRDNSELYRKAAKELGDDVLFGADIVAVNRFKHSVQVLVDTPKGRKLIKAAKLIITVPPKLEGLEWLDVNGRERSLFNQFSNTGYWAGVLSGSGIPQDVGIVGAASGTPYNLPVLPGLYGVTPTAIPGVFDWKYGSNSSLPIDQVKANVVSGVKGLGSEGGVLPGQVEEPVFEQFVSHTPYMLTVDAEAVRSGFYRKLYSLQGQKNTWWTGGTWHAHDSSLLWKFTDNLLDRIVES